MGVNDRQVGGTHYATSSGIQHWDLVELNGLGYLEGCATKYVTRWRRKNGVQDLDKAVHFIEKLRELHDAGSRINRGFVHRTALLQFAADNNLNADELKIVELICNWATSAALQEAVQRIEKMRADSQ
jgi:hypothetical protein